MYSLITKQYRKSIQSNWFKYKCLQSTKQSTNVYVNSMFFAQASPELVNITTCQQIPQGFIINQKWLNTVNLVSQKFHKLDSGEFRLFWGICTLVFVSVPLFCSRRFCNANGNFWHVLYFKARPKCVCVWEKKQKKRAWGKRLVSAHVACYRFSPGESHHVGLTTKSRRRVQWFFIMAHLTTWAAHGKSVDSYTINLKESKVNTSRRLRCLVNLEIM